MSVNRAAVFNSLLPRSSLPVPVMLSVVGLKISGTIADDDRLTFPSALLVIVRLLSGRVSVVADEVLPAKVVVPLSDTAAVDASDPLTVNVAPLATLIDVLASDAVAGRISAPALTLVAPVYVSTAFNVSVPAAALI